MTARKVLITGAAGEIGRMLRRRLARPGRTLRLMDIAPVSPAEPGEPVEIVAGSVTDPAVLTEAMAGVDCVIHLGGLKTEAAWWDILTVNIDGTRNVLEAARQAAVSRVVLASSNHAAGFWARPDAMALPADVVAKPDTYYGVGKAATEALGALYHHRFGMDVICLRIGSCVPTPNRPRALATWLSPDDMGRLAEAAITAPSPGFRVVWGVSRNTRGWWSLSEGQSIGYHPADDAETFAAQVLDGLPTPDPTDPTHRYVGGEFCAMPLGRSHLS